MDGLVSALFSAAVSAPARPGLTHQELRARARRLRLVLTDCDGVLTDATAWYGAEGEVLKRFSLRDGMGVERLREAGLETAILTRERSRSAARRAEKLRLRFHFEGVEDKAAELPTILARTGCDLEQVAYMGDDVNDLGVIETIGAKGLTAAPADAMAGVQARVHFRSLLPGGFGAFREFAEWILNLRREP